MTSNVGPSLVADQRRVLEVLGPDPGEQLRWPPWDSSARASPRGSSTSANGSFAVPPEISTGMKFIDGEPMKPATNRLTGSS